VSETLKSAVQAAILKLLDPLVRLLLAAGIGVGDFLALVKVAYVRAARDEGREMRGETRANVSRIAVVTGLTRAEVSAMLLSDTDEQRTSDRGRQRAERVLSGWWNDPDFQNTAGEPAVLPLSGSKASFKALVARYSNEPRHVPILDELLRVNAVRRHPNGNLQALSRTYATVRWDAQGIGALGEHLKELAATLLHNLQHPSRPRFVRRVVNANLDPRYLPMLVRDIEEQAESFTDSVDDALNDARHTLSPKYSGAPGARLGVAIYVFEEEEAAEVVPPPPKRRSARRSQSGGRRSVRRLRKSEGRPG
jgi:hypothetical protein